MAEYVRLALVEGLHGWQVTDCAVTVTKIAYSLADEPALTARPDAHRARHMKKLVPLVLMRRSKRAGSVPLRAGLWGRRRSADRVDRLDARRGRPPRCRSRDALDAWGALGAESDTCPRHGSRSYGASSRA